MQDELVNAKEINQADAVSSEQNIIEVCFSCIDLLLVVVVRLRDIFGSGWGYKIVNRVIVIVYINKTHSHTHTHTHIYIYIYMYVCMYVYIYICMYVCMYVCICL